VVGVLKDENVFAAGVGASEAESQFVGFAAGAEEITDLQGRRKQGGKAFGVAKDIIVEIARVGVEESELLLDGRDDTRVRVADEGDVVVDVEIGLAGFVAKILAPAANDFERTIVRNTEIATQELPSSGHCFLNREPGRRKAFFRDAEDQIGIGRKAGEDTALRRKANARKIGREIERIENDLKVKMRGPTAVFG
jgi:hypothetical protein